MFTGYRDVEIAGEGGLGRVYRAVRESTGGVVAIKELRDVPSASPAWHRAQRELDAMLRLKGHPYVVSVEEIFDGPQGPCIVMEYLDGGSLMDRIRSGRMAIPELVLVGEQVTQALAAAHETGIVHRDVKPHNLLVGSFGQIKVADFGIAALTRGAGLRTQTQAFTLAYASPEELDGDVTVGPPADVYSFAATFIHLATGRKPSFRERNDLGELDEIARRHPVMEPVAQALRASLETDPDRRPTMAALHRIFAGAASQLGEWRINRLHAAGSVSDPPVPRDDRATPAGDVLPPTVVRPAAPAPAVVPPIVAATPVSPATPAAPIHTYAPVTAQPTGPQTVPLQPVYITAPVAAEREGRRWFAAGAAIALLCVAAAVVTLIATRGGGDEVAAEPAGTTATGGAVTTTIPMMATSLPVTTVAPATTTATTVAPTTLPPTTTVPTTAAPLITAAPLDADVAVEFFRGYLETADAGDYDAAWSMLSARYQIKYKSYDTFTGFWDTVSGTGIRGCDSIFEAPNARSLRCYVWYGRVRDGTISNEIVEVDVLFDTNSGLMLIDDYRYQGEG